jgi:hypothetical protein
MKAEELRALIREVIEEKQQKPLQTGSGNVQQLKSNLIELINNIDPDKVSKQELNFLNQMFSKMFQMATSRDLVKGRQAIQRAFDVMDRGIPTNEEQMMQDGIDDDDHEVHMALSDLHKLEKYAPEVAELASQYSDLPGWVQSKITLAADYLGKVYHYLDGKHNKGME